jgi:hypothetical protein
MATTIIIAWGPDSTYHPDADQDTNADPDADPDFYMMRI